MERSKPLQDTRTAVVLQLLLLLLLLSIRAGRSGDRIPVGGDSFRTRPDRPWGPPCLLYNGYRVIPGGKSGQGVALTTHPHEAPSLKNEYSYNSTLTSVPSWYVIGLTLLPSCLLLLLSSSASPSSDVDMECTNQQIC